MYSDGVEADQVIVPMRQNPLHDYAHLSRVRRFLLWFWPLLLGAFCLAVGLWALPIGVIPVTNNRGAFATMWASGTVAACFWIAFRRSPAVVIGASALMFGLCVARLIAIVFVGDFPYGTDIYFSLLWIVIASSVFTSAILHLSAIHRERLQEQLDSRERR